MLIAHLVWEDPHIIYLNIFIHQVIYFINTYRSILSVFPLISSNWIEINILVNGLFEKDQNFICPGTYKRQWTVALKRYGGADACPKKSTEADEGHNSYERGGENCSEGILLLKRRLKSVNL